MARSEEESRDEVNYEVVVPPRIIKIIEKIKNPVALKQLDASFERLEYDPFVGKVMAGDLAGFYRIKSIHGKYRIVYEIHEKTGEIVIAHVAPRKDVYRELRRRWPPKD